MVDLMTTGLSCIKEKGILVVKGAEAIHKILERASIS